MPYRRRYTRPKRKFKKRNAVSSYAGYIKYVPYLISKMKYLLSMINSEVHVFDQDSASTTVTSTGSVLAITSGVTQGDTNATRTGNSVLSKSLYTLGNITVNPLMTALGVQVRVMWILHKESTGATPAVTDILTEASIESPIKVGAGEEFKVLRDKTYVLTATRPISAIKEFIDFTGKSLHQKWVGATEEENHIYMLWISTESSNPPSIDIYNRFRFYDN